MALTSLNINSVVSASTGISDASARIKSLYGVKMISYGDGQFIDGQSIIDALLSSDTSFTAASALKAGAIVRLYNKYWILLEAPVEISDDSNNVAMKLLAKDNIGKMIFGDTNNFGDASICRYLNGIFAASPSSEWKLTYPGLSGIDIDSLQKFNASSVLTPETTTAQNGDTTYVTSSAWDRDKYGYVALLDEADFKRYYDTNGVLTKTGASTNEPYWLMTPTGCNGKRVVVAQPDGTLSSIPCSSTCGVRPIIVAKVNKDANIQVGTLD